MHVSKTRLEEETYPAAMMMQGEDLNAFAGGTYRFQNFIAELGLMGNIGTAKGTMYDAQQPFAIWMVKEKRTHGLYWLLGFAANVIRLYLKGQYARSLFEASYEAYDEEGKGALSRMALGLGCWGRLRSPCLPLCVCRCQFRAPVVQPLCVCFKR